MKKQNYSWIFLIALLIVVLFVFTDGFNKPLFATATDDCNIGSMKCCEMPNMYCEDGTGNIQFICEAHLIDGVTVGKWVNYGEKTNCVSTQATKAYCEAPPSNQTGYCGDGYCDADENEFNCPQDCEPPVCGMLIGYKITNNQCVEQVGCPGDIPDYETLAECEQALEQEPEPEPEGFDIMGFLTQEFAGIPLWLILAAVLFLLFMLMALGK